MNTKLYEAVRKAALSTRVGKNITGEQLRERVIAKGITTNTPSDWGRATRKLIASGLLVPTGTITTASSPQAHKRKLPVYRRVSVREAALA